MIAYIFGIDINADVLKIVGNPSLITDMSAKLVKYMCKPNYAKVFPYYAQFEGDKDKIFDVRREGGNNQVARLLIHGSIKGTSFLLANKDTPVDGGRYKYRFTMILHGQKIRAISICTKRYRAVSSPMGKAKI